MTNGSPGRVSSVVTSNGQATLALPPIAIPGEYTQRKTHTWNLGSQRSSVSNTRTPQFDSKSRPRGSTVTETQVDTIGSAVTVGSVSRGGLRRVSRFSFSSLLADKVCPGNRILCSS
jgi:hypothetical protein